MTREEFAVVTTIVAVAVGKELTPQAQSVYYDLLKDLPRDVFEAAAKRVLAGHRYPTFPMIAEFREAAAAILCPESELTAAACWDLAWRAAGQIDLEIRGPFQVRGPDGEWQTFESQAAWVMSKLPPAVVEAMRCYSLPALCHGEEPVGVIRGQFLKLFEQQAVTRKRAALLPPALRPGIPSQRKPLAPTVVALLESVVKNG